MQSQVVGCWLLAVGCELWAVIGCMLCVVRCGFLEGVRWGLLTGGCGLTWVTDCAIMMCCRALHFKG